ncbi:MAG: lipoate--protein ligase family protein [Candidatus Micrarchaeota archaeon]|nr:lipoate--protein ligase family protein [Candidatus Micrarchaeota archaeon]
MRWRVMGLETHPASMNMGIDEAIAESVRNGAAAPTIRFYRWNPSAVSIGRFQSMRKEVNIDACRQAGVDWVRRITGGGAVYHDFNGEVTYSVIAPEDMFPKGIRESYAFICSWITDGLKGLGIDSRFVPINDIIADGKKISGNAQTRRNGILLQHGTILYDLDVKKMFSLLNVSKEKISDKMIKGVEDRVTCVRRFSDAGIEQLYESLMKGFTGGKEYDIGTLTEQERKRAEELSGSVYASDGWNFSR